ncbi:MAG: porin family protein [Rhizobiaceae bacterium]|nr:porin family protein [Rhizobiaceae bacterium]
MGNLNKVSVSFAALLASTLVATTMATTVSSAADLPPVVQIPQPLPPEIIPQSYGGWYLRGDIGYAKTSVQGVGYFQGPSFTGEFEQYDIDQSWMVGAGIGYQINDWFRVDLTANLYSQADFTGASEFNTACSDGTVGAICSYSDTGNVRVSTYLANAYVDLGTWQGITPYVGAGIGGALVHWGDLQNTEYSVSGPVPGSFAIDTHGKRSGWRFAYGLNAGASYDISSNLKIDAGYSFTNIAGGEMFGFGSTSGLEGTQGYNEEMKIHAFKVGLRYSLN